MLLAAIPIVVLPYNSRLGILTGVLAGSSLLLWIGSQLALLQVYFFLQPVVAVIGLVEIGLALWWRARSTGSPASGQRDGRLRDRAGRSA